MKTEFVMQLYENEKNKHKATCMGVIDIMFDDMDNEVPDVWNTLNGDPGIDIPWGSRFKFTIEVLE